MEISLFDLKLLPTYVLVGESSVRRREWFEALKLLLKKKSGEEPLLSSFSGSEESTVKRISGLLRTAPLFGGTPLVIVENGEEFLKKGDAEDWLVERISAGKEGVFVVVFSSLDKRTSVYKTAFAKKCIVDVAPLKGDALLRDLRRRAERLAISIDGKAVRRIVEFVGGDFDLSVGELEKVALLGKERITEEDIEGFVSDTASSGEFTISNAIERLNLDDSLKALSRAFRNGILLEKKQVTITEREKVATYLVNQISYSLTRLLRVYKMAKAGAGNDKIAEALSMNEWAKENVLVHIKRSALKLGGRINDAILKLAELDSAIKIGADPKMQIEFFLSYLLAPFAEEK
jgi:DNA polymerase III delta subunit